MTAHFHFRAFLYWSQVSTLTSSKCIPLRQFDLTILLIEKSVRLPSRMRIQNKLKVPSLSFLTKSEMCNRPLIAIRQNLPLYIISTDR